MTDNRLEGDNSLFRGGCVVLDYATNCARGEMDKTRWV